MRTGSVGIGSKAKRKTYSRIKKLKPREYEVIKQIFAAGNRLFLQIIWSSMSTMVDTGMSLASLIPLQKALRAGGMGSGFKYQLSPMSFPPTTSSGRERKKYEPTALDGSVFPSMGEFKSKAHGTRLGTTGFKLDYGKVNRMVFYLDFEIMVQQLYWNENQYFHVLEIASQARMDFIMSELDSLPSDIINFAFDGIGVFNVEERY